MRSLKTGLGLLMIFCAAVAESAPAASSPVQPPPPLPLSAFAQLPVSSNLMLSPDGQRLAALVNQGDRTLLVTRLLDAEESTPVLAPKGDGLRIRWARWVSNERLIVSMGYAAQRWGQPSMETRLLSVRFDGSGLINLINQPGSNDGGKHHQLQDQVTDWLPEDGHHVLLPLPEWGGPALYKINVDTGSRELLQPASSRLFGWQTDAQHRVRLAFHWTLGETEIRVREPEGGAWRALWKFKVSETGIDRKNIVTPLGFGLDPQELYVLAEHEGRTALFSVRLDQPDLPRTLRLAHPTLDIEGTLLRSPATGAVLGLAHGLDEDEFSGALWDPSWRARMQAIDRALPKRNNRLVSISRDEQRYIVHSIGNGQPGEYFVGDRKTGQISLVGETYPDLPAQRLAGKRKLTIKARDGLALNAYLTQPPGDAAPEPRPLVLLPHGGPHARDAASFDVEAEFLASRGYAVLQVNFRGSGGYGRAFEEAGMRRWGLEMQDDLSDAVAWAVREGLADPARICIVGGSYGGYAALMGLVKTPELYRCGASFAGISDLPEMLEFTAKYSGRVAFEDQVGKAWRDRKRLAETSPAQHAQRIRAPVLLIHGSDDRIVPVEQSRLMAKALTAAGKAHRYVEQPGGDHHLGRSKDRLQYFQELEKFLAEHLGR